MGPTRSTQITSFTLIARPSCGSTCFRFTSSLCRHLGHCHEDCCVSSPPWPEEVFFYLLCSPMYTPVFKDMYSQQGLIPGRVCCVCVGQPELLSYLDSCSTSSCTSLKTVVSIFFKSILPVLKLNHDFTICRALSSFLLSPGPLDLSGFYL